MQKKNILSIFGLCLFTLLIMNLLYAQKKPHQIVRSNKHVDVDSPEVHLKDDSFNKLLNKAIDLDLSGDIKNFLVRSIINKTQLLSKKPRSMEFTSNPVLPDSKGRFMTPNNKTETGNLCDTLPKTLVGRSPVNTVVVDVAEVEKLHPEIQIGGYWRPPNCTSRHKVAVIMPYRKREQQIGIFLRHMIPFLQRQQLEYRIFIIEQSAKSRFNRGMLFNIGFKEIEELTSSYYQCYIMTDIDLLPENDYGLYSCSYDMPRHLAVYINIWNYGNGYNSRAGGAMEICTEHYKKINGFSNIYFGWGAEDDDFRDRLTTIFPKRKGEPFLRYNKTIARYTMLKHTRTEKPSPERYKFYNKNDVKRIPYDGVTSLNDTYKVLQVKEHKLYTKITVEIDEIRTMAEFRKRAAHLPKR